MSKEKTDSEKSSQEAKYPLVYVRGLPLPKLFLVEEKVEQVIDLKPIDTDIFIVTYPKCGTTWTQFIVWEILHKGAVPPSPNQMMFQHIPFLEFTGTDILKSLPHPRVMKTHLPFNLQPYNPNSKYIYVVRNPWDVCVSYYYHHKIDPAMPQLTFDEYFELFITGEIAWGDFFDHVLSWYKHRKDPNFLFLTYENMKKNKKDAVLRIAEFLGEAYYEVLKDKEILENCIMYSDFKYLKEMGMFFPKTDGSNLSLEDGKEVWKKMADVDRSKAYPEEFKEVNFFRKGEIGDWKNHFSSDQIHKFNEYMSRKLKNTEMENFWPLLMEETSL